MGNKDYIMYKRPNVTVCHIIYTNRPVPCSIKEIKFTYFKSRIFSATGNNTIGESRKTRLNQSPSFRSLLCHLKLIPRKVDLSSSSLSFVIIKGR